MKTQFFNNLKIIGPFVTLLVAYPFAASAQEAVEASSSEAKDISPIGILPGYKRGTHVDIQERNPFAQRVEKKEVLVDAEGEAAQIIRILEGLRLLGVSRDPAGNVKTVLYGDLRLTEGNEVPQLLPDQNDRLVVSKISNKEVEISWVTEAGNRVEDGRKLLIGIDMTPTIEFILPGQESGNTALWSPRKKEGKSFSHKGPGQG